MTYTIAETNLHRQSLLADWLNPLTLRTLESIALPDGAKILDIGCGLGETSLLLAARFPETTITGIDQNETLIDTATVTKAWNNPAMQFTTGDATNLPFEANTFDLVFTRYCLHHLPDAGVALKEWVRVCKPGGLVFVQEPDANFLASYPESWAYPKVMEVVNALFADALLGRKMLHYFNNANLTSIRHHTESVLAGHDATQKQFYTQTAIAMKAAILKKQLMTEKQHGEWITELARAENDPDTVILVHPTIAVWGTKPNKKTKPNT